MPRAQTPGTERVLNSPCSSTSTTALQPCPKDQRNVACTAWHVWRRGPASTGGVCHPQRPTELPPPLSPALRSAPPLRPRPAPSARSASPSSHVPLTVPGPLSSPTPSLALFSSAPQAGAIQPRGFHCPQADDHIPRCLPRLGFMLQPD